MSITRLVQQDRLNTSSICTTLPPASGLETSGITYHFSHKSHITSGGISHMIHHTDTCHLQESNSGVKVLEEPVRVHELLLSFTRLQMHSWHDHRNTRRFSGFSLTQHSGTQPEPTQHTLTSTLCNSMTSTWSQHTIAANRPISSWLIYLLYPVCTHREPHQENLVSRQVSLNHRLITD